MKLVKLEALRGFASAYVVISHLIGYPNSERAPLIFKLGQEMVMIFFILSGFVIYYSYEKGKEGSLAKYFVKRFRRIYFPFIFALIASFIFVHHPFHLKELLGNLLMQQDFRVGKPGFIVTFFLYNRPLWSLSYEWTFYMLFPFIYPVIKHDKFRVHYIGIFALINVIAYLLFPNHLFLVFSYFIIWWTGLELGDYFFGSRDKKNSKTLIIYYFIIILLYLFVCYDFHKTNKAIIIGFYPYLMLRHFCFALVCLVCSIYLTRPTKAFISLLKPFSYIAPISYSLYVLHYPLLLQASFGLPAYMEWPLKFVILIGAAYVIEVILQPIVNRYVSVKD